MSNTDQTDYSEGAMHFRSQLEQIGESESSFAKFMQDMGDDRQESTILRGLQRVSSGSARFSGELRVLLNLLRSTRNRISAASMKKEWAEAADGTVTATTWDGFRINVAKQKGRWRATIHHELSGYSLPYPNWKYSLVAAKMAALERVDLARDDAEWERKDERLVVRVSDHDYMVLREWITAPMRGISPQEDEVVTADAIEVLRRAFVTQGLEIDERKVGQLDINTIQFSMGPHGGGKVVAVPSAFFKNPPTSLERLKLSDG